MKAESPAVVEATAATLVKGIEEKASKRLAESTSAAPKKPLSFNERVAQRMTKRVDESLPQPGQAIASDKSAADANKEAIVEGKDAKILGGLAKAIGRIHD